MISVSGRKWEEKKINKNLIEKLKQDYNFSDILSKLVLSRKFDRTELSTIDNNLDLNNVFLKNSDFEKSVELLSNSINNQENICILGY
jgi:single-stranded-DNA-specific exonuclease